MGFTLEVENYRALRKVRWSPSGVCAITGPNGAGKTTLLSVNELLRHFVERGTQGAIELTGGTAGIRNQLATPDAIINIQVAHGGWKWHVILVPTPPSIAVNELLFSPEKLVAYQSATGNTMVVGDLEISASGSSVLSQAVSLLPLEQRLPLQGLHGLVSNFRVYKNTQSLSIAAGLGSPMSADLQLQPHGGNIFTVLRNWKAGRREHEEKWLFVRNGLQECFPELFDDLEFLLAGQTVTAQFYFRKMPEPIDLFAAPHGLLVTLFQLCAVASTPDNGAVAIDETENGLHPYAIRTLLELMRARASTRNLTILLATHSPVVLNTFNTEPERVYIMEPGHEVLPIALSEHSNPEWLAHFSLGDLYSDQTFGAQRRPPP